VTARSVEAAPSRSAADVIRHALDWHRPLMLVAALMVLCTIVCLAGVVLDPRQILGAPAWLKPLKFSLSILIYAVTWAWLLAHLPRWRRVTHPLGTVIAVALVVEQVAIIWAAATGSTSHFNVSDPLHIAVWGIMAVSITVLYLCTFVTSIAVFFLRLPTPSLTFAVRAGVLLALVGIGVAFLMTGPTSDQLTSPTGIIGAHTVGVADGGAGLPLLGWSTVGGDYRVAHFIGMHAPRCCHFSPSPCARSAGPCRMRCSCDSLSPRAPHTWPRSSCSSCRPRSASRSCTRRCPSRSPGGRSLCCLRRLPLVWWRGVQARGVDPAGPNPRRQRPR